MPPLSHLTSCTPTESNLYLANSLAAAVVSELALYRLLTFHVPNLMSLLLLRSYQTISPVPRLTVWMFHNKICFYSELFLALHPTPKLENHPLSDVCESLLNIFSAPLLIGSHSSIHNLRTCHAVLTGTHLSSRGNIENQKYRISKIWHTESSSNWSVGGRHSSSCSKTCNKDLSKIPRFRLEVS